MGYVGAHARTPAREAPERRLWGRGAALSLAFFSGLVLSVGALGTIAAMIGRLLTQWTAAFALGTAAITGGAGLAALFGPVVRRRVGDPEVRQRRGVPGAFLYGVAYTVATITTSLGPLILLLTVAAAMGRPAYGAGLSLAYGLGRGLPFLALGLFAGRISAWLVRVESARRAVEVVSGIALIGLSIYFVRFALGSG